MLLGDRFEAADVGTRRTVSLAILNPIVWVTDHTGLTAAANAAARAAGRDPNGAIGGDSGVDALQSVHARDQQMQARFVEGPQLAQPKDDPAFVLRNDLDRQPREDSDDNDGGGDRDAPKRNSADPCLRWVGGSARRQRRSRSSRSLR